MSGAAGPKGADAGAGVMPWSNWKGKDRPRRFKRFAENYIQIPHGHGAAAPMLIYPPQMAIARALSDHQVVVQVIAKGNTKSSTAAGLSLHWCADPPPGDRSPLIPIVSGSKEQARQGVYDTAVAMIDASPALRDVFVVYRNQERPRIECPQTGGVIRPFAPTPRRLHSIIPSLGLVDELGLIHDDRIWQTMVQSIGKRPHSAVFGFGTPGWERGALWSLRQKWLRGELTRTFWMEFAASADASIFDVAELAAANPMRKALDPDGWLHTLENIRENVPESEFRLFNMAQWPEMTGEVFVTPERWADLAMADIEGTPPYRFVAIEGDYARKNVAVMSVDAYDGHQHLRTELLLEHQSRPVSASAIVDAALAPGNIDLCVIRSSGQLDDVERILNSEGVPTERYDTHSAAKMRGPTDQLLEAITDGQLSHDDTPELLEQLKSTRLEPRREGLTLARDERGTEDPGAIRIDGVVATAMAVFKARTTIVPGVF